MRWLMGLLVMLAVALGVAALLKALGVPSFIAVAIGILAMASMEPTSYFRHYVLRR